MGKSGSETGCYEKQKNSAYTGNPSLGGSGRRITLSLKLTRAAQQDLILISQERKEKEAKQEMEIEKRAWRARRGAVR